MQQTFWDDPALLRREKGWRPARLRTVAGNPQTAVKHEAYGRYLPAWLRILRTVPGGSDLYILDLMAGPGRYPDGAPGSPVIAAEAARFVQQEAYRGRQVRVHLRFVDIDQETTEVLQQALAPYGDVDWTVLNKTAETSTADLLRESAGHPTLVLLDPDGFKELRFTFVRSFARRRYTELLLSFDMGGLLRSAGLDDPTSVDQWWGGNEWRALRLSDGTIDCDELLEAYRQRLQDIAGFPIASVSRITFPTIPANRAIVQCAGHPLARARWSAAFRRAARKFDGRFIDLAAGMERRVLIDRALRELGQFANRSVVLRAVLAAIDVEETYIREALMFERGRGQVDWTGRLELFRPVLRFGPIPGTARWDGVERRLARSTALRR